MESRRTGQAFPLDHEACPEASRERCATLVGTCSSTVRDADADADAAARVVVDHAVR